jgi:hypothetical protein
MAALRLPWNDSRCTGRHPDICDTGRETAEEHRLSKFYSLALLHLPVFFFLAQRCACVSSHLDVDQLSNEKILKLRKNASKLHPDAGVVKLTLSTVAKTSQDLDEDVADASEVEANALDLLFAETTIPVPHVRRV